MYNMLDSSAAFDIFDHLILLSRLKNHFGVCDSVLKWIGAYLSARKQTVLTGNKSSKPAAVLR